MLRDVLKMGGISDVSKYHLDLLVRMLVGMSSKIVKKQIPDHIKVSFLPKSNSAKIGVTENQGNTMESVPPEKADTTNVSRMKKPIYRLLSSCCLHCGSLKAQ